MVGVARAARLGVLVKGPQALEATRSVDTVVLDKTGTVTTGRMSVAMTTSFGDDSETEVLRWAGAVESASEHPIAAAIVTRAGTGLQRVADFEALVGAGARGEVDGVRVVVGTADLMAQQDIEVPPRVVAWLNDLGANTGVLVARDGVVAGGIAVRDTVRPSAAHAVSRLHGLGLRTVLLTGDGPLAARAVADEVGITDVIAKVLPTEKVLAIETLRAEGHCVAMVGDGVNDGPALAAADLGMAMARGSDVAAHAADIILVRDDLHAVPDAVELATRTLSTIRGNLAWAFSYNAAAIPLAAFGLLNPLIAAAAMSLSSVLVVTNSLRLRGYRPNR
jgi:P-type Cu+ transporter